MTGPDSRPQLGSGALALVSDELDELPMVDERHRLWPWSLRALARRRRCSPGTVHKHHQALSAAGVLLTDDQDRTLVDTARLEEAAAAGRWPTSCRDHRAPANRPSVAQRDDAPAVTVEVDAAAEVLVAIEALTSAVEARRDLAGVLMPIIGRLAQVLEDAPPARALPSSLARADASGARGRMSGECGSDQVGWLSTPGAGARRARDRAPSKKERSKTQSSTPREMVIYLVLLSHLSTEHAREGSARRRGARARARPSGCWSCSARSIPPGM